MLGNIFVIYGYNIINYISHFRAISVGIYTTNSSSACLYCAEFSKANIIVVQNEKQLQKILEIKHQLPLLKAIIQYEEEPTSLGVYSVNI